MMTEGPHIYYVDPQAMVLKGEIPWYVLLLIRASLYKYNM